MPAGKVVYQKDTKGRGCLKAILFISIIFRMSESRNYQNVVLVLRNGRLLRVKKASKDVYFYKQNGILLQNKFRGSPHHIQGLRKLLNYYSNKKIRA